MFKNYRDSWPMKQIPRKYSTTTWPVPIKPTRKTNQRSATAADTMNMTSPVAITPPLLLFPRPWKNTILAQFSQL